MDRQQIEKQIGKFLSNLSNKLFGIAEYLTDNMKDFVMDLDQLDIDKLSKMLSKFN